MSKKSLNIISLIFIILCCVLGFQYTNALKDPFSPEQFGPDFFPTFLLYIIIACSALQLVKTMRQTDNGKILFKKNTAINLTLFVIAFSLYVAAFLKIGFILPTLCFIFVGQILFGRRDWIKMCLYSILITAATYAILTYAFQVQLP